MCFLLFASNVNTHTSPPIEDILISFKHERHKTLCGSLVGFIHLNFATQHCWNEHFLRVHMGAAITSDSTKSLIVRYRYLGQYISRNVGTCRQSRFYGKNTINIINFLRQKINIYKFLSNFVFSRIDFLKFQDTMPNSSTLLGVFSRIY